MDNLTFNRGLIAGAAPFPGRAAVQTPAPAGTKISGVTLNADGTFTTPDGRAHSMDKVFASMVEGAAYLSVMPGEYGQFHHPDGSATFFRREGNRWFVGRVEAAPLPVLTAKKKPVEPPRPEQQTTIYCSLGDEFEDRDLRFTGRRNGVADFMGTVLPLGTLDVTVNGWRIRRAGGSGVLCLSTEAGRHLFRFCPRRGWWQLKTAPGRVESINSDDELFFFSWWHVLMLLGFVVLSGGIAAFDAIPRLWCIFTHSARPLPASFFSDDAASYIEADELFKIGEVARDPMGKNSQ